MKAIQTLLAALMVFTVAGATTACGTREFTTLPPTEAEKPKDIGTITVTVIDHESKPVAGATLSLLDAKGAPVAGSAEVETAADGTGSFKKVPVGQGYTISAEYRGISGSQAGLGIDGESPLIVKVMLVPVNGARGTIGGSVIDGLSGLPLDGATVSVMGTQNTVKTQADGSFILKDVPVGNPTLVAALKNFAESRSTVALKGGQSQTAAFKLFPIGNGARFGNTLVSTLNSIIEFDRNGNRLGVTQRGGFQARALSNGNTLIANSGGVTEINASNMVVWSYSSFMNIRLSNPQGVSRASNGNVFIADTNNNRVLEVSPGQKVQRTIKSTFNKPASAERVEATRTTLVADTGNHRVVEVDDGGAVIWMVGDGTTGLVNHPTYATRLPNGNTLITDSGNHRVMEVNRAQKLVWMFGGDGKRETCYFPNSAVRMPNGNTLIADTGNDRVIEVNGKGETVKAFPGIEQPLFADRL